MSMPRLTTLVATKDAQLAVAEVQHHLLALALFQVAVHGLALKPRFARWRARFFTSTFRAGENNDGGGLVGLEDMLHHRRFLWFMNHVGFLSHAFCGLAQRDADLHGVVQT
jgi:hypothetical protein